MCLRSKNRGEFQGKLLKTHKVSTNIVSGEPMTTIVVKGENDTEYSGDPGGCE